MTAAINTMRLRVYGHEYPPTVEQGTMTHEDHPLVHNVSTTAFDVNMYEAIIAFLHLIQLYFRAVGLNELQLVYAWPLKLGLMNDLIRGGHM